MPTEFTRRALEHSATVAVSERRHSGARAEQVLSFAEHRNSHKPYGIDVSQDGNLVAATGDDNRVRVWSLSNRGCSGRRLLRDLGLKPWLQANGCAFSPEAWSPRWAWAPSLWCATDRGLAAISYASAASKQQ